MSGKSIKILLATGIFYPDVGGPAIHVKKIAEALTKNDYRVVVISYGDYSGPEKFPFEIIRISNKLSPAVRRLKYLLTVLKEAVGAKILYAFNLSTAGLPVFIVGKLLWKKILIRVPGDPIWERTVENGRRFISFVNYYRQGLYKIDRPWLFRIIKFTLPRFDKIVFYTTLLSEIYLKYYDVPADKINIILHPVFRRDPLPLPRSDEPTILFAGRFVAYKNLEMVVRVFDRVRQKLGKGRLILIGEGPDKEKLEKIASDLPSAEYIKIIPKIDQEKLFGYICFSWVGIGPALTEFNPNFILECLSFGRLVLLSKENGSSVKLSEEFLFDANDGRDLEIKMANFFDSQSYKKASEKISKLRMDRTWGNVTGAHLEIIRDFIK